MKKSWKKALLAGLSIVMMGSFIAGCGSNNGADNKDVLKVGVTQFCIYTRTYRKLLRMGCYALWCRRNIG